MSRRNSRERWASWLVEQQESGQTVAAFCAGKGVSQNSFYQWRRKLGSSSSQSKGGLVPVSVVASPGLEVELSCGATIKLPDDAELLRRVLSVLVSLERAR